SDWSSMRPRPSLVSQRRPDAPDISAEPTCPNRAPDGNSLFVNVTRAVTPSGGFAPSASAIAWSSGLAGGGEPLPPAATAIAARPTATTHTAATRTTRLRVESLRRKLTAILSLARPAL